MVYYRKIIKTTTYGGRNFFVYIIEENKDDKTEYLINKIQSYVDTHPETQKLWENVTLGIDQELEIIELNELELDDLGNRIFEKVGIDLDNNVIIRASINFTPNVNKVIKSGWHRDQTYKSKVLIYYFNTNNGYTEFQTGEKIDSVQDRLITFDGVEDIHRSVSQTDTKMRLVLNVNYE